MIDQDPKWWLIARLGRFGDEWKFLGPWDPTFGSPRLYLSRGDAFRSLAGKMPPREWEKPFPVIIKTWVHTIRPGLRVSPRRMPSEARYRGSGKQFGSFYGICPDCGQMQAWRKAGLYGLCDHKCCLVPEDLDPPRGVE